MAKRDGRQGNDDQALREHLVKLIEGGQAHVTFDQAIKRLPAPLRARAPRGLPYSPWQILEHMRIAQWDILDFSRNREYQPRPWPEGYWPAPDHLRPTEAEWRKSVADFRRDLSAMQQLVGDRNTDLHARIPWGDGQTILREALLVADHNAYHLGELVVVRRLLGAW